MKLFYHPGSNPCRRALATAYQLELPIELKQIDFMDDHCPVVAEMTRLDPAERVPLLEDGGFVLGESTAIMHYLCSKKVGSALLPEDSKKRCEVIRWQSFAIAHLNEATGTLGYENLFKKIFQNEAPDPAEVKEGLEQFRDHADVLEKHLKGKTHFVGNALTLADFSIAAELMYWEPAGMPLPEFKNLHAWYQRIDALPAWKKSAPKM